MFEEIERKALKPLPAEPFAIGRWLTARANIDYHIDAERHFYSVPYRLVHKKLDVFVTSTAVTVFADGNRVASHTRSFVQGKFTTLPEHMPPEHLAMAQRTPDKMRQDAVRLGPAIGVYVDRLLTAREHPEQGIRSCLGIFRLAKSYGAARLALACERALAAGALSSGYVEKLLKADQQKPFLDQPTDESLGVHSFVRGSSYYN